MLESLISINNKLGQKEAAAGLLEWGKNNLQGELKVKKIMGTALFFSFKKEPDYRYLD